MTQLAIGDSAPEFSLPRDGGENLSLDDFHGHYLVLYFYPKDDTPGCTLEAVDFSAKKSAFNLVNGRILGVSKDTVAKHDKFDMYGRKYMGIERATFLIGPTGKILEIWRKVRAKGHVEIVYSALKSHAE